MGANASRGATRLRSSVAPRLRFWYVRRRRSGRTGIRQRLGIVPIARRVQLGLLRVIRDVATVLVEMLGAADEVVELFDLPEFAGWSAF